MVNVVKYLQSFTNSILLTNSSTAYICIIFNMPIFGSRILGWMVFILMQTLWIGRSKKNVQVHNI